MSRNKKLNSSEKKQVQLAIDKAKNKKKGVKSAQDSIPYTRMFKDGICLVNEFIEKIVVHEAVKDNGKRQQQVDIHLNFIGQFEPPFTEEQIQDEPQRESSKRKKRRHEMTEEERQKQREIDRNRYAKRVAEKKAKEQAERLVILQGTKYEVANEGKALLSYGA